MFRGILIGLATIVAGLFGAAHASAVEGPVLVFGGTGGTGLATVQFLRKQDVPVTVFVRPTSDISVLEPLDVKTVVGDALDAADVNAAYASEEFASVVSSLGGRRGEPRPDLIGNRNINNGALASGVRRVIQVTAVGTGKTREAPADMNSFAAIIYLKTLAEDELMASGLDYTIVRPPALRRGEATGRGILAEGENTGAIDRQELGRMIVQFLDDDATIGKILYPVDPGLKGSEEE